LIDTKYTELAVRELHSAFELAKPPASQKTKKKSQKKGFANTNLARIKLINLPTLVFIKNRVIPKTDKSRGIHVPSKIPPPHQALM
jgi:hypothetical protein